MPIIVNKALLQLGKDIGADISLWEIEESIPELLQLLPEEHAFETEIQKFKSLKRKKEWLATRDLFYTKESERARIVYASNGAPRLLNSTHRFISISHSHRHACILLSSTPISIDIEAYSPRAMELREKFMNEDERKEFVALSSEKWATLVWSCKESVYKQAGISGLDFRKEIIIRHLKKEGHLQAEIPQHNKVYTLRYLLLPAFVLTVCF